MVAQPRDCWPLIDDMALRPKCSGRVVARRLNETRVKTYSGDGARPSPSQ
jgi:hypothetical protein